MNDPTSESTRAQAATRIITLAMISGVAMFAIVSVFLVQAQMFEPILNVEQSNLGFAASMVLLLVMFGIGHTLRRQGLKPGPSGEAPSPTMQQKWTIIYLAMIEMPALLAIVLVLLSGALMPLLLVPALAIVAMTLALGRPSGPIDPMAQRLD